MKNKIILLGTVILFGLLGVCSVGQAADISPLFSEDFNSYSNGDVRDQGGWTGNIGPFFVVDGVDCLEGKCLRKNANLPGVFYVTKTGTDQTATTTTLYFKLGRSNCVSSCQFSGLPFMALGLESIPRWYGFYENSNGEVVDVYGKILGVMGDNVWTKFVITSSYYEGSVKISVNIGDQPSTGWEDTQLQYINTITFLDGGINSNQWKADFIGYGENSPPPPVQTKNPILIVPGLVGTEMKSGSELLWLNMGKMLSDAGDNFMDYLIFDENLNSLNADLEIGSIIGSPFIGKHTYDLIIQEFKNQGYIENQTLFTFPYDWRYGVSGKYPDNKTNSDLFGEKIQQIIQQTGSDKVDVVAHSMGGLIVKKYAADHQLDHHIGKAVFVGVPNTGSVNAIKVLLQGDNFGIPWLAESEIKKISENMPATYDLLPSQQYYANKGSFVQIIDQGLLGDTDPVLSKNLNYEEFKGYIADDHSLNSQALANAINLHTADFDNFDLRTTGIDLYAIDGCKAGTIGKIVEDRFKNILGQTLVDYKAPKFAPGDGTVPLESATNLPINSDHKFYSLSGEHSKMMSQEGNRQQIVNLLAGSNLEVKPELITQDIDQCNLNGKAFSVYSPIDIYVTDQHGNHLGNAPDGSVVDEIPNAAFETFGEHKFLYLPSDEGQTYNIKITGTGTGTYTINGQDINNGEVIRTQVFSNLAVTPQLTGQVNFADETLTVQDTPSDAPKTILPSATLDSLQSQDVLPPVSIAVLSGTQGQAGFYRSDVSINLSATDDSSGVLALHYKIDSGTYQNISIASVNIPVTTEGGHALTYFATDKAGNNEIERTINFTIDKIAPETIIQFDQNSKDLIFSGTEQGIVVNDGGNVITLADQAGNKTEIILKDKDRKKSMAAEIKSLKYNGVAADISKNIMAYRWNYDKNKVIKELSQHVRSKKDYNVFADYDGKNTKFEGKDGGGKISQKISGLKIIKITTNKGDFDWSY